MIIIDVESDYANTTWILLEQQELTILSRWSIDLTQCYGMTNINSFFASLNLTVKGSVVLDGSSSRLYVQNVYIVYYIQLNPVNQSPLLLNNGRVQILVALTESFGVPFGFSHNAGITGFGTGNLGYPWITSWQAQGDNSTTAWTRFDNDGNLLFYNATIFGYDFPNEQNNTILIEPSFWGQVVVIAAGEVSNRNCQFFTSTCLSSQCNASVNGTCFYHECRCLPQFNGLYAPSQCFL